MKYRHAAALALVGWYLMAPATTCKPIPCHVENYSIGNWGSLGSFDTAEACIAKLDAQRAFNLQPGIPTRPVSPVGKNLVVKAGAKRSALQPTTRV